MSCYVEFADFKGLYDYGRPYVNRTNSCGCTEFVCIIRQPIALVLTPYFLASGVQVELVISRLLIAIAIVWRDSSTFVTTLVHR